MGCCFIILHAMYINLAFGTDQKLVFSTAPGSHLSLILKRTSCDKKDAVLIEIDRKNKMMLDIERYLQRIHYTGSLTPTIDVLRDLHRAHMFIVPFENLDIHLGRPIVLDEEALYRKIVEQKRGGFCYELNGLFAAL